MASAPSPLPPPPPTRQLFVRFRGRHRPRSRRDVEELFSDFGRLKHAHHGQSGDVAFVTYWHLRDACEAVARLDGREYRGYELRVGHSRVTRLLAIGDVQRGLATPTTEAIVREEVAAYGAVAWTLLDANKNTVYVMMRNEADAARATRELQGRERGGWRWEIEFYKENAIRPPVRTQSSLDNLAPATATPVVPAHHTPAQVPPPSVRHEAASVAAPRTSTPPSAAAAAAAAASSTPIAAVAATEKQNPATRERSPSPRRSRSRSHSPPPRLRSISRSQSRSRSRSRSPPRKGKQRRSAREERSPSHSSSSQSSSPSPPRKKGRRRRARQQPSQERSRSPAPARLDRRLRSEASPEAQQPPPPPPTAAAIECGECLRLVTHLNKDHSISEDEQTKQLVKAWFNGNFELATKRDPSRKPESIRRLRFLDEHVNPFLESAGLATWTTRTPLYAHWFQREVLRLSAAEVGHSRPLQLHRRTSVQAYAERLRHLLAAVENSKGE